MKFDGTKSYAFLLKCNKDIFYTDLKCYFLCSKDLVFCSPLQLPSLLCVLSYRSANHLTFPVHAGAVPSCSVISLHITITSQIPFSLEFMIVPKIIYQPLEIKGTTEFLYLSV